MATMTELKTEHIPSPQEPTTSQQATAPASGSDNTMTSPRDSPRSPQSVKLKQRAMQHVPSPQEPSTSKEVTQPLHTKRDSASDKRESSGSRLYDSRQAEASQQKSPKRKQPAKSKARTKKSLSSPKIASGNQHIGTPTTPDARKTPFTRKMETLNERLIRLNDKFNSLYGIDYMEARKTLRARLRKKRYKTEGTGLTLAEKILLMRRMKGNFDPDTMDEEEIRQRRVESPVHVRTPTRSDTGFASVDISHITGQEDEDEKRSPTPSPTFTRHKRVILPEVAPKPRTPTPIRRIKTVSPVQKIRTPTPELVVTQPVQNVQRVPTPVQEPREEAPKQNLSLQLKPGYTVIPEIGAKNRPVYVPRDNFYRSKSDTEITSHRPGNDRKASLASAPGDLRQRVKKRKQDEVLVHDLSLAQKIILQRRVLAHWENYHRPEHLNQRAFNDHPKVVQETIVTYDDPQPRRVRIEMSDSSVSSKQVHVTDSPTRSSVLSVIITTMSPAHNRKTAYDNNISTEAWANEDRRHVLIDDTNTTNTERQQTTENRRIVVDHTNYSEPIQESTFHVQTTSKKSDSPTLTKTKSGRSDFEKQTIVTDTHMRAESVHGYEQEQRTLGETKQENKAIAVAHSSSNQEYQQGSLAYKEKSLRSGRNTPAEKQIHVIKSDQYIRADVKRVSNANDRPESPLNPHTTVPPITMRVENETSRYNNDRDLATTYQPGTKERVMTQDSANDHYTVRNDHSGPVVIATVEGVVSSGNSSTRPDSQTRSNGQNYANDVPIISGPTTKYGRKAEGENADTSKTDFENNGRGQHLERPDREHFQGYNQSGPYVAAAMDEQVVARSYERDDPIRRETVYKNDTRVNDDTLSDDTISAREVVQQVNTENSTEPRDKPTISGQIFANGNDRTTENNVINASLNGGMNANVSLKNEPLNDDKVTESQGEYSDLGDSASNGGQTIDNGTRQNDDKGSNRPRDSNTNSDIAAGTADNHPSSNDNNSGHTINADFSVNNENKDDEATTGSNNAPDDVNIHLGVSINKSGQNRHEPAPENAPKPRDKRGDQPDILAAIADSAAVAARDVGRDNRSNNTQREPTINVGSDLPANGSSSIEPEQAHGNPRLLVDKQQNDDGSNAITNASPPDVHSAPSQESFASPQSNESGPNVEPESSQSVQAAVDVEKPTMQGQPADLSAPNSSAPKPPANKPSNKQAPNNKKENQPRKKNGMKDMSQNELNNYIEALDKLVDHDLKTLINGSRNDGVKPEIDEKILQKVMSDEFQAEMDEFLQE